MNKAYVVIDLTVKDIGKMKQYVQVAKELVTKNDGKFIANSEVEVLYGASDFSLKAIIEFPNVEYARAWYHSTEYQKIIPIRSIAMDAQFHLIS